MICASDGCHLHLHAGAYPVIAAGGSANAGQDRDKHILPATSSTRMRTLVS